MVFGNAWDLQYIIPVSLILFNHYVYMTGSGRKFNHGN